MAFSWTQSGITHSLEYERVPVSSVDARPSGRLSGVTGGQLNWNLDSTEKVSGSLDVVKTGFVNNCYVRIFLRSTVPGGASRRVELATCFASTEKGHYEDGAYSGRIELHGVLVRFTDDKLKWNFTIPKGSSALGYFKKMFQWYGGQYRIAGVRDRKTTANKVFERGKPPWDALKWLADFLGAEVTCDSHGRVVLQPYVPPGRKPVKYTVPVGGGEVTLPGVDITSTQAGTVNAVSVRHEWTEKVQVRDGNYKNDYKDSKGVTHKKGDPKYKEQSVKRELLAVSVAEPGSAVSRQKAGRWITETYDLQDMSPKTDARIKEIAKTKLKRASGTTVKYSFETLTYLPLAIGQVVGFRYDKLRIHGLVRAIDLSLDDCTMKVELRKVRNG